MCNCHWSMLFCILLELKLNHKQYLTEVKWPSCVSSMAIMCIKYGHHLYKIWPKFKSSISIICIKNGHHVYQVRPLFLSSMAIICIKYGHNLNQVCLLSVSSMAILLINMWFYKYSSIQYIFLAILYVKRDIFLKVK